jgi:hypothetical protein
MRGVKSELYSESCEPFATKQMLKIRRFYEQSG